MDWQKIKVSSDNTHFLLDESMLYGRAFKNILKFHAPGLAPVEDNTGWFHIDAQGKPLYSQRYLKVFGY